jgi:alpha-tubulin suppressor-like RCC1 family protein
MRAHLRIAGPAWGKTAIAVVLLVSAAASRAQDVIAWEDNVNGQCDVPGTVTNPVAIVAGGFHGLALSEEGTVVAWGKNWEGRPTCGHQTWWHLLPATHSLALGDGSVIIGPQRDGKQTCRDGDQCGQVSAAAHNLALRPTTVVAWGTTVRPS